MQRWRDAEAEAPAEKHHDHAPCILEADANETRPAAYAGVQREPTGLIRTTRFSRGRIVMRGEDQDRQCL
jgi:hypothetical protein